MASITVHVAGHPGLPVPCRLVEADVHKVYYQDD
jgi:hypothetical protein